MRRIVSASIISIVSILSIGPWLSAGCGEPIPALPEEPGEDGSTDPGDEAAGQNDWGKADAASTMRRADWVVSMIKQQIAKLPPEIQRERNQAMAVSPFTFFRGADLLYWADFAKDTRLALYGGPRALAWLQGDLHPLNFGSFDDDRGEIVYGLNDFDEGLIADYQLDVWRMAAGIALMARDRGGDAARKEAEIIDAFAGAYLAGLDSYRGNDKERDAAWDKSNTTGLVDDLLKKVEEKQSRSKMLDEWTVKIDGQRVLDPTLDDLEPVDAATAGAVKAAMPGYGATLSGGMRWSASYFAVKGVARRLHAGTGSLGAARYYVLIEGESSANKDDRLLDVKQQGNPAGWGYVGDTLRRLVDLPRMHHGQRVAHAQKALGVHVDDHLGWLRLADGYYTVRERSPYKGGIVADDIKSDGDMKELAKYWGAILAAAHARSDNDYDPTLVATSLEKEVLAKVKDASAFRKRVTSIGVAYANQTRLDYEAFRARLDGAGNLR